MSYEREVTLWDLLGLRYGSGQSPLPDPFNFQPSPLGWIPQSFDPNPLRLNESRFRRNEAGLWLPNGPSTWDEFVVHEMGHLVMYSAARFRDSVVEDEFDALFGDNSTRWELLSLAIGDFLRQRTGLPIDFQFQRQTEANLKIDPPEPPPFEVRQRETPAIGYRSWYVKAWRVDGEWTCHLEGYGNYTWSKTEPTRAACDAGCEAPTRDHSCGLYAHDSLDDVAFDDDSEVVFGAVMAWGRIFEYVDGFRAEFAQPIALTIIDDMFSREKVAELVAEQYGVPLIGSTEKLAEYVREFGAPLAAKP